MNIKHIFLFTIFVLISSGFLSEEIEKQHKLLKLWVPKNESDNAIQVDNRGNTYIRVITNPNAKRNELFVVPGVKRIGVNIIINSTIGFTANLEVMDIFAKVLKVPFHSTQIYDGVKKKLKTVKIYHGFVTKDEVITKIIDKFGNLTSVFV